MATKPKTITIEAPYGGWIENISPTGSSSLPFEAYEGRVDQYTFSKSIDMFRLEKPGMIAPGQVFTAITDTNTYINAMPLNGKLDSNAKSFLVLKSGRVVRTNNQGTSTEDYYAPSSSSSTNNPDIIVVNDAATTPNEYILSTYETSTSGYVMIAKQDGSNKNQAYTTLSAGVPLKLTIGPDGNIYGTNGQYLWSAQMALGVGIGGATITTQALNLGANWVGSGICAFGNFIATIGYRKSSSATLPRNQTRVWFWDGFSPEPNFIYDIPDNFGNAIYFDGQQLIALTSGSSNSSRIWSFNGSAFVQEFQSTLLGTSNTPKQGSLETYYGGLVIGANTNHIYQWYRKGFHDKAIITDGTNEATDVGMVKNLYQAQLFIGVTITGPAYKVYYNSSFSKYTLNSDFRSRLFTRWDDGTPIRKGKLKRHHFWLGQNDVGSYLLVSVFKGDGTSPLGATVDVSPGGASDYLNLTVAYRDIKTKYVALDREIDDLSSFFVNLRFNHTAVTDYAMIVRRYVIEGEETDVI